MAKGFKTGGRRKGSLNRPTREVAEILRSLDCDPIGGMTKIAMDPQNTPELRGKMFADLARYVYPQRKAVEHTGTVGNPIQIVISPEDAKL